MNFRSWKVAGALAGGAAIGLAAGTVPHMNEEMLRGWVGALSGWVGATAAAITLFFLERQNGRLRDEIKRTRTMEEQKRLGACIAIDTHLSATLVHVELVRDVSSGIKFGYTNRIPNMSPVMADLLITHAPFKVVGLFASYEILVDIINDWPGIEIRDPQPNDVALNSSNALLEIVPEMKASLQKEIDALRATV